MPPSCTHYTRHPYYPLLALITHPTYTYCPSAALITPTRTNYPSAPRPPPPSTHSLPPFPARRFPLSLVLPQGGAPLPPQRRSHNAASAAPAPLRPAPGSGRGSAGPGRGAPQVTGRGGADREPGAGPAFPSLPAASLLSFFAVLL